MVQKQLRTGPPSPLEKVRKFPSPTTVPRATTLIIWSEWINGSRWKAHIPHLPKNSTWERHFPIRTHRYHPITWERGGGLGAGKEQEIPEIWSNYWHTKNFNGWSGDSSVEQPEDRTNSRSNGANQHRPGSAKALGNAGNGPNSGRGQSIRMRELRSEDYGSSTETDSRLEILQRG